MAKKRREQPTKQFLRGERKYCKGQAREDVADVMEQLETLRGMLGMYPQAFECAIQQVHDLPYKPKEPNLDAFVAFNLCRIFDAFADRLREVGVRNVDDPHAWMQHVDLSAAADSDDIDHEAVRQSAFNQSDDADAPSIAGTDEDVAKSAEVADDKTVRDSLGVEQVDAVIEDITHEDTREMMESLGVGGDLAGDSDEFEKDDEDDEEEDDEQRGGGSERVQLDMLDAEGTQGDPALCAQRATRLLFRALVRGYGKERQGKPGLYDRMKPLIEYGVLTRQQVVELLQDLVRKSECIDFSRSIERYEEPRRDEED